VVATPRCFGHTLSNDGLSGKQFEYMLSNPPFGVEWKKIAELHHRSVLRFPQVAAESRHQNHQVSASSWREAATGYSA
jgi:type I restriction-modification system DNA methylase subunit